MLDSAIAEPWSDEEARAEPRSYWRTVGSRLKRDKVTLIVGAVILLLFLMAAVAPWLSPYDPYDGSVLGRLKPLGTDGHWFGTDETGRDMWTRLVFGSRLSLLCGVVPVVMATLIGGALGLVAGVAGGAVNTLIMRVMDVLYAFPSVLLAIAICGVLGAGLGNTLLSLTVIFIPPLVRITESLTTQVRNMDFVDAARASGANLMQLIRHQVLANVLGPVLVYATSLISISIILSAGLSFLGLGVTPPEPEWGLMLNALRQAIWIDPLLAALPGVMIFITSMCFNLLSDGLRGAMDVRLP